MKWRSISIPPTPNPLGRFGLPNLFLARQASTDRRIPPGNSRSSPQQKLLAIEEVERRLSNRLDELSRGVWLLNCNLSSTDRLTLLKCLEDLVTEIDTLIGKAGLAS